MTTSEPWVLGNPEGYQLLDQTDDGNALAVRLWSDDPPRATLSRWRRAPTGWVLAEATVCSVTLTIPQIERLASLVAEREEVTQVRPRATRDQLDLYLISSGWIVAGMATVDSATVRQYGRSLNGTIVKVQVPLDDRHADYRSRVEELLEDLCRIEGRSVPEILEDAARQRVDVSTHRSRRATIDP